MSLAEQDVTRPPDPPTLRARGSDRQMGALVMRGFRVTGGPSVRKNPLAGRGFMC